MSDEKRDKLLATWNDAKTKVDGLLDNFKAAQSAETSARVKYQNAKTAEQEAWGALEQHRKDTHS